MVMMKLLILGVLVAMVTTALIGVPALGVGATYSAELSGAKEVPPVMTPAMGEATFMLSPDGTVLTYKLTVSNLTNVTAAHIHLAPAGVNGPIVVGLFGGSIPGLFTGVLAEGTITSANLGGSLAGMPLSALITQMNAGNTYVNVHTMANPGGEMRGQIELQVLP